MKIENARRQEAGFTLIELMIVIAIIGILAAIAIPQYEKYIVTAKAGSVTANFKNALNQVTAGFAAVAAGQSVDVAAALNPSSKDPLNASLPAFVFTGGAPACGQIGIAGINGATATSAVLSTTQTANVILTVGDTGCAGSTTQAAIDQAITAAGYSNAVTTTGVTVTPNGGVS